MSDRSALLARAAPVALVLLLAAAVALPLDGGLSLASADADAAAEFRQALGSVPDAATVLVGFDPDIGTYAEVRPTVRTVLAELGERGATLAFVSLTTDGRALALAEMGRLRRLGADPERLVDLGFVPGAEAALVALARELDPADGDPITTDLAASGIAAPDLALVVGGLDMGPRSWVEQVGPRRDDMPLAAIAPAATLPELLPYRQSGQLAALIATPRDGAAYRAGAPAGAAGDAGPSALAVLAGMGAAIAVLAQAIVARGRRSLGAARPRDGA